MQLLDYGLFWAAYPAAQPTKMLVVQGLLGGAGLTAQQGAAVFEEANVHGDRDDLRALMHALRPSAARNMMQNAPKRQRV